MTSLGPSTKSVHRISVSARNRRLYSKGLYCSDINSSLEITFQFRSEYSSYLTNQSTGRCFIKTNGSYGLFYMVLWPLDGKSQLTGKDPDAGKDWKTGEWDDRGWDGWTVSLTQWTWIWVGSRSWWWTGKPGVLQSMGLQRVGHDWVTELNLFHPNPNKITMVSTD